MVNARDVIRRIELYCNDGFGEQQHGAHARDDSRYLRQQSTPIPPSVSGRAVRKKEKQTSVLIEFRHGLGAAVQLTIVLRHLKHYHPDWNIDVVAPVGKHSAFAGLCRRVFVAGQDRVPAADYDRVFVPDWLEPDTCYANCPSTSAERCLANVFRLSPIPDLCRYVIEPDPHALARARRYLEDECQIAAGGAGRYRAVLIHYEGNTQQERKNLPVEVAGHICEEVIRAGATPIILDWDRRTPLADGRRIRNPGRDHPLWGGTGTGDAAVLAALTELSMLMIGVNSGPLHVAGATSTPAIGVWSRQHPLHYFALANNLVHLVPQDHLSLLRGNRRRGEAYFRRHYIHRVYESVESALSGLISERLGETASTTLIKRRGFWLRNDNLEQDVVIVRDVAEDDAYQVDRLPGSPKVVVDVGAHIGCFAKRMHERHPAARILAVECCPENLPALRKNVGEFAVVVPAALTYEQDVALLNAVYPDCGSTGGSIIVARDVLQRRVANGQLSTTPEPRLVSKYWADLRPLPTVTLEQLFECYRLAFIDVLKLDCEGSEFSILESTTSLDRIGRIIGEYHDKDRFLELIRTRFADWKLRVLKDGKTGLFWLSAPNRPMPASVESNRQPSASSCPQTPGERTQVLVKFRHGLGDAVQLTCVLKHLRHFHPDWDLDVAALVGKSTAFHGLCNNAFVLGEQAVDSGCYHRVYDLPWHECHTCYANSPSTKAERCLRETFGITPTAELCTYSIRIGEPARRKARRYLDRICSAVRLPDDRYPAVLIHYQGNTSGDRKNLPVGVINEFCNGVIRCGMVPVILDWDERSPLPDGKRIHNPDVDSALWGGMGTGDAEVLAALIEASSLLVGVDSGPLHVAAATTTPTVGVWTGHHPLHYMGLGDHVLHLIPRNHATLLRGDPEVGLRYFEKNYRFELYDGLRELPRLLERHIAASGSLPVRRRVPRAPDTQAPVETAEAPIFVSGHPRSGTTWMQCFLCRHADIHIHGQLPDGWDLGWQWYQQLLESGVWAERANERMGYEVAHYAGSGQQRCRQVFAALVRDFLTGFGPAKRRWGVKSLTWCLQPGIPEHVQWLWPEAVWVVCIRNPFLSIASEKNTFRPEVDVNMAARTWTEMCRFAHDHDPRRTVVFQIDKLPDTEARIRATARVLATIGVSHTAQTLAAAEEFAVVHKVTPDDARSLELSEDNRRRMIDEVPQLAHWMELLGYLGPGRDRP